MNRQKSSQAARRSTLQVCSQSAAVSRADSQTLISSQVNDYYHHQYHRATATNHRPLTYCRGCTRKLSVLLLASRCGYCSADY